MIRRVSQTKTGGMVSMVVVLDCSQPTTLSSMIEYIAPVNIVKPQKHEVEKNEAKLKTNFCTSLVNAR